MQTKLIGVIGDLETVTGFLLAGVGSNQHLSPNSTMPNYFVVTENTPHEEIEAYYKAMIQTDRIRNAMNQLREVTNGNGCIGLPAVVELPPRNSQSLT